MEMRVKDVIEFYLFGALEIGTIVKINKDKTLQIAHMGVIYPNVQIFKTLPKKKKDIPPWYILK
tara:strand:+ start:202 stop:393 length:192 start_codon:yes stop_codon:yes gene_type:complete